MDPWAPALQLLWQKSRFVSYFYQMVEFVEDEGAKTLGLALRKGRVTVLYHHGFIGALSVEERVGLLVHEMLHLVFGHDHRGFQDENPHLQNLAQDMVVNSFMDEVADSFFSKKGAPLSLPPGLPRVPERFFKATGEKDPSWEALYRFLKHEGPEVLSDFTAALKDHFKRKGPEGEVEKEPLAPGEKSETSWQLAEPGGAFLSTGAHSLEEPFSGGRMKGLVQKALLLCGQDLMGRDDRMASEVSALISSPSKVNTRPLQRLIRTLRARGVPSRHWECSTSRFNRRYFAQGVYAAGRRTVDKKLATLVVDLSASMVSDARRLEEAFGVLEGLLSEYSIRLLCIDEVLFVPEKRAHRFSKGEKGAFYTYKRGDWRLLRSGNSGTTFFSSLFNGYLQKGHKEAVVVITDGEIYDIKALAPYPNTLWILPSGLKVFDPPFGEVMVL